MCAAAHPSVKRDLRVNLRLIMVLPLVITTLSSSSSGSQFSMLAYVGQNISLEFLYSGPRSLFTRMHLNDSHGALDIGPNY
jgi:hypothetical protein